MGGGSKTPPPSPYETTLADIAKQTFEQSDPIRQAFLSQFGSLMSGGFDPQKSPLFAPMYSSARSGLEGQYDVAKENILAGTPRGGGQVEALANLEGNRADKIGAIPGMLSTDILTDLLNKSYGMAFGAPQQSMSGLSSAAGTYSNRAGAADMAAAQQQSALYGGLGTMLGMGGGMALAGPLGGKAGAGAGKAIGSGLGGK